MADDVERSSSNSKEQLYFENAILIFVQMLNKVHNQSVRELLRAVLLFL